MFLSGDLMNRLIPEIEKICAYANDERITLADIEATAHHIPEADAFQMTDCLSKGDFNGAARYLSELMAGNREPIEVLGAIGWQMRRLYAARLSMDRKKGSAYTKEILGIKNDYALRMLESTAKNIPLAVLREYVRQCAEMDFRMKTSAGEELEILKELLVRFAMEGHCA
jgi:DNA polymerase-3 subunit delta